LTIDGYTLRTEFVALTELACVNVQAKIARSCQGRRSQLGGSLSVRLSGIGRGTAAAGELHSLH
jgi:hypothetical protein